MKGVSQIIGHTLAIAIAVSILSIVLVQVITIKSDIEGSYLSVQADLVAEKLVAGTERIISLSKESFVPASGNVTLALIEPSIPDRLSGRTYEVLFEGQNLVVRAVSPGGEVIERSRELSGGARLQGAARSPVKLKLERTPTESVISLVE